VPGELVESVEDDKVGEGRGHALTNTGRRQVSQGGELPSPALTGGAFLLPLMSVSHGASPSLSCNLMQSSRMEPNVRALCSNSSILACALLGEVALEILFGLSWLRTIERSLGAAATRMIPAMTIHFIACTADWTGDNLSTSSPPAAALRRRRDVDLRLPAAARGAPDGALPRYVGARAAIGSDRAHIDAEQRWTLDQGTVTCGRWQRSLGSAAKPVAMRGELAKGLEDDQVDEGRRQAAANIPIGASLKVARPRCRLG
jgi:hypothetical protein